MLCQTMVFETTAFPLYTLIGEGTPATKEFSTGYTTSPTLGSTAAGPIANSNLTYVTSWSPFTGYYFSSSSYYTEYDLLPQQSSTEFLVMIPMLVMSIGGMYGNAVMVYTLTTLATRSQHLIIMLSLALSDFCTACFLMPCICLSCVTRQRPLGEQWCKIFPFLAMTVLYTSFGHLGLISFEQCLRLWNPLLYKRCMTKNMTKLICMFIWFFAAVAFLYPIIRLMEVKYIPQTYTCMFMNKNATEIGVSSLRAKQERYALYAVTMTYKMLILLLMSFSYCFVFIKLIIVNKKIKKKRVRRSVLRAILRNKSSKSAVVMLAVVLVFVYSWMPDFIIQVLAISGLLKPLPLWLTRYQLYNYYISPVFNPLIYSLGYKHVRSQMISTIKMNSKTKFVSLEDGPPLKYRSTSQVERSENFYKKIALLSLDQQSNDVIQPGPCQVVT